MSRKKKREPILRGGSQTATSNFAATFRETPLRRNDRNVKRSNSLRPLASEEAARNSDDCRGLGIFVNCKRTAAKLRVGPAIRAKWRWN